MEIAIVGVAVVGTRGQSGRWEKVSIALGSVAPTVLRASKAATLLLGEYPSLELHQEAARLAATDCSPIDDLRASAAYRRSMVEVLVRRALETQVPVTPAGG